MKCVIYGRDNCSFCKRAVELAKQLQGHGYGEYQYIDIVAAGIDKQKLSGMVGKPVETIPGVFGRCSYRRLHRICCFRKHSVIQYGSVWGRFDLSLLITERTLRYEPFSCKEVLCI